MGFNRYARRADNSTQQIVDEGRRGRVVTWLTRLLDKLAAWYWRDPIAAERHRIECDVRRLRGKVIWND